MESYCVPLFPTGSTKGEMRISGNAPKPLINYPQLGESGAHASQQPTVQTSGRATFGNPLYLF